jgi:hypothetical protein
VYDDAIGGAAWRAHMFSRRKVCADVGRQQGRHAAVDMLETYEPCSVTFFVVVTGASVFVMAAFVRGPVAASIVTSPRLSNKRGDEQGTDKHYNNFLHGGLVFDGCARNSCA